MRDCFYSCFLRIFKSQKMPGDNPRLLEALSLEKTSSGIAYRCCWYKMPRDRLCRSAVNCQETTCDSGLLFLRAGGSIQADQPHPATST